MTALNLILYIGIPAIFAAVVYFGRKLQILDTVAERLDMLERKVESLYERFIRVEERVEALWMEKFIRSAD
ncbi:MAG: hypothetical protein JWM39_690 [Parcubacteria group bacterium]|nr:hypothetical protein [Parcubacteria group bacterium]